jgi:hypothetical protein
LLAAGALAMLAFPAAAELPIHAGLAIGTLGGGVEIGLVLSPDQFGLRFPITGYKRTYDTTSDGVSYKGHLELAAQSLLADWHPFAGSFRLTVGVSHNGSKFDLDANPTNGTYTFNGHTYTAAQVGSATASVRFRSAAPYLGFGWGDDGANSGLHFTSDIGVVSQGRPQAKLSATGELGNAALASDLQAAQTQLQDDLKNFRWYPLIQFGMVYRF